MYPFLLPLLKRRISTPPFLPPLFPGQERATLLPPREMRFDDSR